MRVLREHGVPEEIIKGFSLNEAVEVVEALTAPMRQARANAQAKQPQQQSSKKPQKGQLKTQVATRRKNQK